MKYLFLLLTTIAVSCGDDDATRGTFYKIQPGELKYQKGDCLQFKIDSLTYGMAIVANFSKDEGGLWYGLLITDYESKNKPSPDSIANRHIFGRKVESGLNPRGFETTVDVEYTIDSIMAPNFLYFDNISLADTIMVGSRGASAQINEFVLAYKRGKERRVLPPDDYREHLSRLEHFRPDEYFNLKDFIKK